MPRYLIYGLGKRWNLCKYLFPDECIAGYTDKAKLGEVMEDGRQVVDFSEAYRKIQFDKVLITSDKYYDEIRSNIKKEAPEIETVTISDVFQNLSDFFLKKQSEQIRTYSLLQQKDNIVHLRDFNKIYVMAPAMAHSGGPELLHQLVFYLRKNGIDAEIAYYNNIYKDVYKCIPNEYRGYIDDNATILEKIEDNPTTALIIPETSSDLLKQFNYSKKYFWWMSVDNFIWTLKLEDFEKVYSEVDCHLYQSEYAREFLVALGINAKMMKPLSDYIEDTYIESMKVQNDKSNIVTYNPAKGRAFTEKLIEACPEITFVPIQNMTRNEVRDMLRKSKVYIDFGNHPGKDRIPREAALSMNCIVTGRRGAAANPVDIPIPERYKISENISLNKIRLFIQNIMQNYDQYIKDFELYRNIIKREESVFQNEILDL